MVPTTGFGQKMHGYRSGCKNAQISNLSWGMESMDPELSKTVPGMSLRPLDRFLEFDEKISEGKKSQKSRFLPKLTELQKYAKND